MAGVWARVSSAVLRLRYYIYTNSREVAKHKLNFLLGFCSTWIVVLVIALAATSLRSAPAFFLEIAETNRGEIDLRLVRDPIVRDADGRAALNFTVVDHRVQQFPADAQTYSYSTPRIDEWTGEASSLELCDPGFTGVYMGIGASDPCATGRPPYCVAGRCPQSVVHWYLADMKRERRMHLGRQWPYDALKPGECYFYPVGDELPASAGDTIIFPMNLNWFYPLAHDAQAASGASNTDRRDWSRIWLQCTVKEVITNLHNKFQDSDESLVITEFTNLGEELALWMHRPEPTTPTFDTFLAYVQDHLELEQYATQIIFNLPPIRQEVYLQDNFDDTQRDITRWSSILMYRLGFHQFLPRLRILEQYAELRFLALFFGLILNIILLVLMTLSVILIYSLLMISVETRTFELGVLRMVGMSRGGTIALLSVQSMFYSLPSVLLGLLAAQGLWGVIGASFTRLSGVEVPETLDSGAMLTAIIMGVGIPVVASILPIRKALGTNLHDALDTKRSKTAAVKFTIERSEDKGINWAYIVLGVGSTIFGFLIYYGFPLALLSFNLGLLLNIFLGLLLGMLFGLVILSLNVQPLLERVFLALLVFWDRRSVRHMIGKNLIAHRLRNRKTAVMYSLSLAFILFITVSFQLQTTTTIWQAEQEAGTTIKVSIPPEHFFDDDGRLQSLPVDSLASSLLSQPGVKDLIWISHSLQDVLPEAEIMLTNLGHVFATEATVLTVTPSLWAASFPGYLTSHDRYSSADTASDEEAITAAMAEDLMSAQGSQSAIVGRALQTSLAMDLEDSFLIEVSDGENVNVTQIRPLAMLDLSPVFRFSQYANFDEGVVIVPMPQFVSMSRGHMRRVDEIPMREALIVTEPDADLDAIFLDTRNTVSLLFTSELFINVFDLRDNFRDLATSQAIVNYFFSFTTIVALTVCFFSLASSMYSNIYEQAKELAVLRAIGINKFWLVRVFVLEAFVLVISASFAGIASGFLVALTLVLQRALFTGLPIPFVMPWPVIITVASLAVVFAVISAWGPITAVLRRQVVQIFRL